MSFCTRLEKRMSDLILKTKEDINHFLTGCAFWAQEVEGKCPLAEILCISAWKMEQKLG